MSDPLSTVLDMQRPKLLVSAARIASAGFERTRMWRQLFPGALTPKPGAALAVLIEDEAEIDRRRRTGEGAYSATRHVALLTALIHEAQLVAARRF